MTPVTAAAARRGALAAAAIGATLGGHVLTGAHLGLLPVAPALWAAVVLLAVLWGARRIPTGFTAWSPGRVLALLVAGQLAVHAVLARAPWALGVAEHHTAPLLAPSTLAAHAAVALAIWMALCFGQRVLVVALAVARVLLGGPAPRLRRALRTGRVPIDLPPAAPRRVADPRTSRGPPARTPATV